MMGETACSLGGGARQGCRTDGGATSMVEGEGARVHKHEGAVFYSGRSAAVHLLLL